MDDYSVEGRRLRIMWDEGAGPLWADEGLLPDDPAWLRRALSLSEDLIADLRTWLADMTTHLYGVLPREQLQQLNDRGQELADRLQVEVGDAFNVSYRPEKVTYLDP